MTMFTCECEAHLQLPKGCLVECPSCEALHNMSTVTKHKTAYCRCECGSILSCPRDSVYVKCPSCAEMCTNRLGTNRQRIAKGKTVSESRVKSAGLHIPSPVPEARRSTRTPQVPRFVDLSKVEDSEDDSECEDSESDPEESDSGEDVGGSDAEDDCTVPRATGRIAAHFGLTPKRRSTTGAPGSSAKRRKTTGGGSTTKKKKATPPEKRLARYRNLCPQKVYERIVRAKSQRMFMISAETINEITRKYAVLGSTGNVYNVEIGIIPSCSCPDHMKGNTCKHILLIFLKVLKVPAKSSYIYQKALLTSEVREIFDAAPPTLIGVLANATVRKAYAQKTGKEFDDECEEKGKQRPLEGDCPVCMEDFTEEGTRPEQITFCKECGNNIHKVCLREWKNGCRRNGNPVTCVYCRADWVDDTAPASGACGRSTEGYMNLAAEQGMSRERDSSTYSSWHDYHHGGWGGWRNRSRRRRWY